VSTIDACRAMQLPGGDVTVAYARAVTAGSMGGVEITLLHITQQQ